jgi:hypothetical protein
MTARTYAEPTLRRVALTGLMRRRVAIGFALVAVIAGVLARPALAHNVVPTDTETRDGHYRYGAYPAADAAPRWYYESRFPGKKNTASSYKDATRRGALEWFQAGATFRFVSSGYREQPYFVDPYYAPDPAEDIRSDGGPRTRYCEATAHDDPDTPQFESGTMSLVFWPELPPTTPGDAPPLAEATTCNRVPTGGGPERPFKFFLALNRLYATCDPVTQPPNNCHGGQWYRKADPDGIPNRRLDLQSVATHEFGHATGFYWHFNDPGMNTGTGHVCNGGATQADETMCQGLNRGTTEKRTLSDHDLHTFRTDATQAGAYPAR